MPFLNLLNSFIIMIFIIFAAYLTTRWFAAKANRMTHGKYISQVDRIFLGRDKSLLIVKIGSKYFLMSDSSQGISLISALEDEDLVALEAQKSNNTIGAFNDLFNKYLGLQSDDKAGKADNKKMSDAYSNNNLKALKDRMAESFDRMTKKRRENLQNDDKE